MDFVVQLPAWIQMSTG